MHRDGSGRESFFDVSIMKNSQNGSAMLASFIDQFNDDLSVGLIQGCTGFIEQ